MKIAGIVAWPIAGPPVLVVLGEPRSLAVLLSFVVLLTVLDQAPLAITRRARALPLDDGLRRFCRRCFVQLLDESSVRPRPVLSLGVLRFRISALSHVHVPSQLRVNGGEIFNIEATDGLNCRMKKQGRWNSAGKALEKR